MDVVSFWSPSLPTFRIGMERPSCFAYRAAPSPSSPRRSPTWALLVRACERHRDHHRDCQKATRSGGVRGSPAPVGGREVLRLDQPQPAALEGPGGNAGLREGLPVRRLCHDPHPATGTRFMSFGPDSESSRVTVATISHAEETE